MTPLVSAEISGASSYSASVKHKQAPEGQVPTDLHCVRKVWASGEIGWAYSYKFSHNSSPRNKDYVHRDVHKCYDGRTSTVSLE